MVEPFSILKRGGRRISGCYELSGDGTPDEPTNTSNEPLKNETVEESPNTTTETEEEQDPVEWLTDHYYKKFIEEFREGKLSVT